LRDGKVVFANGEPTPPINADDIARLRRAGGGGILGIRPEHFMVGEQAAHGIAVAVELVEPLGSDTMIHFGLAGTPAIGRVDPALRPKVGDRLALGLQPNRVHLFDSATGQVLS
jgi:multiple sugar transport system ATP-binding protein